MIAEATPLLFQSAEKENKAEAEELGVQAVHLEVTRGNEAAALYARLGFEARPHRLMTRRLLR